MWMFPEGLLLGCRENGIFVLLDTYLALLGFVLHNPEGKCPAIGMDIAHDGGIFQLIGRRGVDSSSTPCRILYCARDDDLISYCLLLCNSFRL